MSALQEWKSSLLIRVLFLPSAAEGLTQIADKSWGGDYL